MSNQYIIYNFRAEIHGTESLSETADLTGSSAIAKRSRDAR